MDRICLIALESPFLIEDKVQPPLGILYVASSLLEKGFEVVVHDGRIEDIPESDIYGISSTTPQFHLAEKARSFIKKRNSKARVIIGGPHASTAPESCKAFDGVVIGDGEVSAFLMAQYKIKLIECPSDKLYHPARHLIDLKSYKYKIDERPATTIMTSKGCPYSCAFCCQINKFSAFNAEFVREELFDLIDNYGYRAFMFFDDIFILQKQRMYDILHGIKDIIWRGFSRADAIVRNGEDTLKFMAESGCREIGMGLESGSDKILKIINKKETTDIYKRAIEMIHNQGIRIKGFLIIGLPSESKETIQETYNFLEAVGLDDLDISIYQPLKKSHIYENKNQYDIFWDNLDFEKNWWKGTPGEYKVQVHMFTLTSLDILEARDMLEGRFKKWT